jgi:hypothetical protein
MSCILYYSNFCEHSKNILSVLGKSKVLENIHFICIDNRTSKNGRTYILLETGQEIVLPNIIVKVPSLLLLNDNKVVCGHSDILTHINPVEEQITKVATQNNMEPSSYSMGVDSGSLWGVSSDNYSFLDMTSDELSAKGSGGTRQMYNYASLDATGTIETPPDTYTPDKIGEMNMDEMQRKRESEIKK